MKSIKNRGYTLIELLVVVALIAIVAAVVVPQLSGVNKRTDLSEAANRFQRTIADAKSLAMKNRRAVVVEVRTNSMWVNVLGGTSCTNAINNRCFHLGENGSSGTVPVSAMCDLRVATMQSNVCTIADDLLSADPGIGICYNGSGQLWIRRGVDTNTDCTPTSGGTPNAWEKACVPWIGASGAVSTTQTEWFSGVDVRFNDDLATCPAGDAAPAGTESVTRRVQVPAGGHPHVTLVGAGD